jgi:glyoxylase-like metal-dependent hydrolase (beta-lactamase superfamily II)
VSELSDEKIVEISKGLYKLGPLGNPKVLCSYLLVDEEISIVDCGPSAVIEELLNLVSLCGVGTDQISNLFLTHIHLDHAGGASKFLDLCKNSKAFVPRRGYKHLIDPSALNRSAKGILGERIFNYWEEARPIHPEKVHSVDPNEKVSIGKRKIQYVEATGHAPHHNVLFDSERSILFAADGLGISDDLVPEFIAPTSPPPSFNYVQARKDIEMIQKDLSPQLVCLAHFRIIKPDLQFYSGVMDVFDNWRETIHNYFSEKSESLSSQELVPEEINEIYAKLATTYSSYNLVSAALIDQVKRVDISGFAKWYRESESSQEKKTS